MDLVSIGALFQTLGLPLGLAIFFMFREYQTSKEHKQDLKDIAIKAVAAIDAGTEAIKDSTEQIKVSNNVISNNSNIIAEIKGVLSNRGAKNGMANGN